MYTLIIFGRKRKVYIKRKNTALSAIDLLNNSLGPGKYLNDDGKRRQKHKNKNDKTLEKEGRKARIGRK